MSADHDAGRRTRWDRAVDVESRTEHRRLRLPERRFDPFTTRLLAGLGIRQGTRCLEAGAGAGSVALWLAERAGAVWVAATDLSVGPLAPVAAAGVRVLRHDVTTDGPPGRFDLIHARAVLDHVRDREHVLRRLVSWLAPGGRLLVECTASQVSAITHPATRRVRSAMQATLAGSLGYDPNWALTLPLPLERAGLSSTGAEGFAPLQRGGPDADLVTATIRTLAPQMIADGTITEAELTEAYTAYADLGHVDFSMLLIAAWGTKA